MYVKRAITGIFRKLAKEYPVIALVGARQSGKTTFLKEQMTKTTSYVLFDDPDARAIFEEDVKKFENQYIRGHDVTVLDEIQNCSDAGRKLKYLADQGHKLWITGSSDAILAKEVLSFLVGRVSVLRMFPFSVNEFVEAKAQPPSTPQISRRLVWEHMVYGGYPKLVLAQDNEVKRKILGDLYETMILKDVARTFSIDDIRSLETFSRYLAVNSSALFSFDNAGRDLNIPYQTLRKYLTAFEKSYLVTRLEPFYKNRKNEIIKQPKVYYVDTGLRNVIAKQIDAEPDGKLFEGYAMTELLKLGVSPRYWRTKTKQEVDFVVEIKGELIPIEAKKTASAPHRSLHAFIDRYRPKKAIIVVYEGESKPQQVAGCTVITTDVLGLKESLGV